MYIFLEESGDLGTSIKGSSRYFVLLMLVCENRHDFYKLRQAAAKTLKRKVNKNNKAKKIKDELKGIDTTDGIKQYFYQLIQPLSIKLYTLILNKENSMIGSHEKINKHTVYNQLTLKLLDQISFPEEITFLQFMADEWKTKNSAKLFNQRLREAIQAKTTNIPCTIEHLNSKVEVGLQSADLFAYGLFQKYEHHQQNWYQVFADKIVIEKVEIDIKKDGA